MYTFSKNERLCSQRLIDTLFEQGHKLSVFPFSVRYLICPADGSITVPAQVLIVAPKRKLHHAVDRNHAKRLMRELYRLNKPDLYQTLAHRHLLISINYIHHEVLPYHTLEKKYAKLQQKLFTELQSLHESTQQLD